MKSVLDTIVAGTEYLEKKGVEDARLNMEYLLARALGCRRLDLYLQFDRPLQEEELSPCRELVKRRGEREPLQHLLGDVDFLGREFLCDGRALIPRPETEVLVERVAGILGGKGSDFCGSLCDVGCGSGVIGLSLAAELGDKCSVTLVDVCSEALALAAENLLRLGLGDQVVRLVAGNLLELLPEGAPFDAVVANLPYVETGEIEGLQPEVHFDPVFALDGGVDGLDLVRRLIAQLPKALVQGGLVALELGPGQAEAVCALLEDSGFRQVTSFQDHSGVERFVTGHYGQTETA